ncbi:hypothetical protein ACFVAV_31015 [Nocardia sp. NPDC057663]|uniref:hypothetical protein n=1 Tax=Nocardia sp. NPDC057663 TaxID=3346201 RepID=UPI003671E0BB
MLEAVKTALYERQPDAEEAMVAATSEFAAARWRRDTLFLRALPPDGTIPALVIKKFRITFLDVHRLVPAFAQPLTLTDQ